MNKMFPETMTTAEMQAARLACGMTTRAMQTGTVAIRNDDKTQQANYQRDKDTGEWRRFGQIIDLGPAEQFEAPAPKTKHDPKRAKIEAALEQFDREHEENQLDAQEAAMRAKAADAQGTTADDIG